MVYRAQVSIRVATTHIKPVVSAIMDTTGKFRLTQDFVLPIDLVAILLTKPLSDAVGAPDAVSVAALKVLADGFAMNDDSEAVDGSVYTLAKGIQNVTFTSDTTTQSAAKGLSDSVVPTEALAKVLARPLADVFDLADDETVAALKGLSDSVTMQDTLETLLLFIRNFNDTVSVPDVRATLFTPATKAEQVTVTDADTISFQKSQTDDVTIAEAAAYAFTKPVTEAVSVADVENLLFALFRVESVSVADAGVLSVQDYAELDYFVEDYVGVSQSF